MRTITKARWVPDIPTPEAVEELGNETGMVEIVPEIQNFNLVSVKPEKKVDWNRVMIIIAAILPMTTCLACTELMRDTPLLFAVFGVTSILWNALIMAVNIKRKSRS